MAKKTNRGKKPPKRAAASKRKRANVPHSAARSSSRRRAPARRARPARVSRGLESTRYGVIAESEPQRSLEAGQSGDLEALSGVEDTESESVRELAEEGQDFEAELVAGEERAANRPGKQTPAGVDLDAEEDPRPRPRRQTL